MQADIALIGGNPLDRLIAAINLRRQGLSVHSELFNRKRDKMWKRAVEANWRGASGVADITDGPEFAVVTSRALDFARG